MDLDRCYGRSSSPALLPLTLFYPELEIFVRCCLVFGVAVRLSAEKISIQSAITAAAAVAASSVPVPVLLGCPSNVSEALGKQCTSPRYRVLHRGRQASVAEKTSSARLGCSWPLPCECARCASQDS